MGEATASRGPSRPCTAGVKRCGLALLGVFLVGASTNHATGQTLDDVRDELGRSLRDAHALAGLAGLIILSDELELSGAHYEIDDGDGNISNTEMDSIALPLQKRFHPWGEEAMTHLYLEGVLGYARANQEANDLYAGLIPGLETSVDSDVNTYGGLLGIGPEFVLFEGFSLVTILNGGIAYIQNDTDYGGPGASASAQLLDGLAFNWDGWTLSGGGALRADWIRSLGRDYQLELVGRYDIRWVQTFATDDVAQEFSSRYQIITLRADTVGPTGFTPFARPLYWRATAAYRHFFEGSLFDVQDLVLLGGNLEYDILGILPFGERLTLGGGVILGEDVTGYTVGLGVLF